MSLSRIRLISRCHTYIKAYIWSSTHHTIHKILARIRNSFHLLYLTMYLMTSYILRLGNSMPNKYDLFLKILHVNAYKHDVRFLR